MADGALTVVGFAPVGDLPSPSPFCLKLETWLRMAGIPYEASSKFNPFEAPRGKAPYLRFPDGELLGDSAAIVRRLRDQHGGPGLPEDAHLRARAIAATRILEDHLYFLVLHERWVEPAGFAILKESYFGTLAWPMRVLMPALARRGVVKAAQLQGASRYPLEERKAKAEADLEVLALWLGEHAYLGGDAPCEADATAYGFLANALWAPFPGYMQEGVASRAPLRAYCERVRERYWSSV